MSEYNDQVRQNQHEYNRKWHAVWEQPQASPREETKRTKIYITWNLNPTKQTLKMPFNQIMLFLQKASTLDCETQTHLTNQSTCKQVLVALENYISMDISI